MHRCVKNLLPMVNFISLIGGENCEVVLHDLSDYEHSVVAVSENNLTGRKVGDPITDLAIMVLHHDEYKNEPYVIDYLGYAKSVREDKEMTFRSSTFFIRDEQQEIVGLLCVNIDVTDWLQAKHTIERLSGINKIIDLNGKDNQEKGLKENLNVKTEDLIVNIFEEVFEKYESTEGKMHLEDRKNLISDLNQRGYFKLKGAVTYVSLQIGVSEQSVYRYIKEAELRTHTSR